MEHFEVTWAGKAAPRRSPLSIIIRVFTRCQRLPVSDRESKFE